MKIYPLPDRYTTPEVVILADGEYPERNGNIAGEILHNPSTVVCCDGAAANFTAQRRVPSALVGDRDPQSGANRERYQGIIYRDSDQETNDLTKAFRYCINAGYKEVAILGATGRCEDHTLGNISLLCDYSLSAEVYMVTGTGIFNAISGTSVFESQPGQQVSIFALESGTKVAVENLVYQPPSEGLR